MTPVPSCWSTRDGSPPVRTAPTLHPRRSLTVLSVVLAGLLSGTALTVVAADEAPIQFQRLPSPLTTGGSCASGQPLCLQVTVGLADPANPGHCPTTASIVADVGDQLAWCYTVSNQGSDTLNWHSLRDSVHGDVVVQVQQALAPGQSLRYVHRRTAAAVVSASVESSWTASVEQPSYSVDGNAEFDYVDVSDGIALEWTGGFANTRSAPLQLPFSFDFYGAPVDQLCVGKNGGIEVGLLGCTLPAIFGVPTIYAGKAIAVAWSEFSDTAGSARAHLLGDTPGERKMVIEWRDMVLSGSPPQPGFTFQVVIDEASDELLFQYQQMGQGQGASGDNGGRSAAGLQSAWYLAGLSYSDVNIANLSAGTAVRWTPLPPATQATAAASVDLDIGAARLLLPLPQINAETPAGTTTYRSLPLVNIGNRRLDWQAGEYPAQSLVHRYAPASAAAPEHAASELSSRVRSSRALSGPAHSWTSTSTRGAEVLPAFGVEHGEDGAVWNHVGLDLLDPATTTFPVLPNLPAQQLDFSDSTFVDNDFSRQWVMDWRSRSLYTVDTDTGATRLIGIAMPRLAFHQEGWYGLAWDPSTDTLYGSTATAACGWSGLYRIDMDTAQTEFVGPIVTGANVCVTALSFDPSGQLYAIDISSRALVAINKQDGTGQLIGTLGYNPDGPQGLAADPVSGELYLTATPLNQPGRIGRIDPVTGIPEWLAPPANGYSLSAISIARAGADCNEVVDAPWLELGTLQGAIEPNTSAFTITLDFDATELDEGDYAVDVCIFSNDPQYRTRPEIVPIRFTVQPAPDMRLFADGFE
jgi:hypothetical protein